MIDLARRGPPRARGQGSATSTTTAAATPASSRATVGCRLNHAWLPFFGTVIVGMLAAFALALAIAAAFNLHDPPDGRGPVGMPAPTGEPHGLEEELRQ